MRSVGDDRTNGSCCATCDVPGEILSERSESVGRGGEEEATGEDAAPDHPRNGPGVSGVRGDCGGVLTLRPPPWCADREGVAGIGREKCRCGPPPPLPGVAIVVGDIGTGEAEKAALWCGVVWRDRGFGFFVWRRCGKGLGVRRGTTSSYDESESSR